MAVMVKIPIPDVMQVEQIIGKLEALNPALQ